MIAYVWLAHFLRLAHPLLVLVIAEGHPVDCSPPGSSVHGILQARILERVAIPFSRGSSPPRDRTRVSYIHLCWRAGSLPPEPPGSQHVSYQPPEIRRLHSAALQSAVRASPGQLVRHALSAPAHICGIRICMLTRAPETEHI